ncbi:ABC transporter ATP-binding protein [Lentilactobacillus kosonis]|uniref:Methionine ABC transporter ATP-binding protein n=1 Tax=Lentilactobacillus kosonis TaxID=2810561 RepID=A0A401FMG4_9LACO|nr:ATP-binding cassette domain-containing protein [Lentilactobacillus kosonis]GAY73575.1 methionine ABC transporter ATP-binding protein [Lentilactobacillus kosonis]
MNSPSVLEMQHVHKIFFPGTENQRHILKDVSLDIHPGDFISVIGNNGAGKSTLLNVIAGNLKADAGTMQIMGNDITNKSISSRSKWISRVFQDAKLGTAGDLTVYENMAVAEKVNGHVNLRFFNSQKKRQAFKQKLTTLKMGLANRLDTPVKYLSGGQRQALSLLMATISSPSLLLLDEHTAALDPKTSAEVMELTNQVVNEQQLTSLMITHKVDDALTYGNRLIMVQDGQIKVDLSSEEKKNLSKGELMALFEN